MNSQDTITKLAKLLDRQSREFLFYTCEILGIESNQLKKSTKKGLIEKILGSDNLNYFKVLLIINDFSKGKNEIFINQRFEQNFEEIQNMFENLTPSQKTKLNKFNKLVLIYFLNPEEFNNVYFISWWKKEESTNMYIADHSDRIPDDLVKSLYENDALFLKKIEEVETSKYKKSFNFNSGNDHFIFWKKQVSDSIEEDIETNKRVKGSKIIGIYISDDGKNLEIKTKSKKSSENVKKIIETDILKINYSSFEQYANESCSISLENSVTLPTSEIKITEISFKNSELDSSPEVRIKHKENDISNSIKQLQNLDILRYDFTNISHFKIVWNNMPFKISVELDEANNRYKLTSTRQLEDSDKKALNKDFSKKFQRSVNKWINIDEDSNQVYDLDYFLKNGMTIGGNDLSNSRLVELNTKNLINLVDFQYIKCYNDYDEDCDIIPQCEGTIRYEEDTTEYLCPQCNREIDLEVTNKQIIQEKKIILDISSIRKYIVDLLKDNDFDPHEKKISIDGEKHPIYEVKSQYEKVNVLILNAPITSQRIKFIERYKLPTIFILLDSSVICKNIIDSSLYPQISFGKMLEKEKSGEFKDIIKDIIKESYLHSLTLYEKASKISHKKLIDIPETYSFRDLEIDIFNLLRYTIPSCDKMGDSDIGKALPDGIFSIHYSKNSETYNFAYIYDCKFSQLNVEDPSKSFKLDRTEFRKILEHIKHINQTNEISHQFTGGIKSFILFSNKLNKTTVEKLMEYIDGESRFFNEELNIKVVLFELNALLYFYEQVVKKKNEIEQRREIFYENLNDLLCNPTIHNKKDDPVEIKNDRVIVVNRNDIINMINSTLEEKKIYDFIKSANINEYLKRKGVLST